MNHRSPRVPLTASTLRGDLINVFIDEEVPEEGRQQPTWDEVREWLGSQADEWSPDVLVHFLEVYCSGSAAIVVAVRQRGGIAFGLGLDWV